MYRTEPLTSSLNDLVVGIAKRCTSSELHLDSAREIAIRSLRDVELNQVSLSAVDMIRVKGGTRHQCGWDDS